MSDLSKLAGNMTPEQLRDLRQKLEEGTSDKTAESQALYGADSDNDKARGLHHHTDYREERKDKNFDEKIYMFPESYNKLREELQQNWDSLWALVQWSMAFRAELFIEYMNHATDLKLVLDSDKVGWICDQYLTRLRQMRGLSR